MKEIVSEPRLAQLESLLEVLAESIDQKPGARDLANLAKQYRETLAEIEEIRGKTDADDEVGEILKRRIKNGKSGAVRKNHT